MADKKEKKPKKENPLGLAIFVIIMLIIAAGLLFIFREPSDGSETGSADSNITRAKSYFTYPTDYKDYVLEYSNEFGIDPCYIFAVIRTESSFIEDAESEAGARGLMQIMPDAFDWIQFRLGGDDGLTFDDMYTAKYNIRYGTYMLSFLYEEFGSYELASAAYHQGMNAVQSWIDDGTIDPAKFNINDGIDDMPSAVTRDYIYKVMRSYDKYKENTQLKEDIQKWKN